MWQRKQTIFLAVVVFCMALSVFFPVWTSFSNGISIELFPIHYSMKSGEAFLEGPDYFPYCIVAVLAVASSTLGIIEIGKFNNRMLQLKLGALNSLLIAACVGLALYFVNDLNEDNNRNGSYGVAIILPLVAMLSNMVANRFIRKDEKKVRDADRIR